MRGDLELTLLRLKDTNGKCGATWSITLVAGGLAGSPYLAQPSWGMHTVRTYLVRTANPLAGTTALVAWIGEEATTWESFHPFSAF
jgi:hypothetical protein